MKLPSALMSLLISPAADTLTESSDPFGKTSTRLALRTQMYSAETLMPYAGSFEKSYHLVSGNSFKSLRLSPLDSPPPSFMRGLCQSMATYAVPSAIATSFPYENSSRFGSPQLLEPTSRGCAGEVISKL